MIDIHSHILPGIDDGAKDFANSVEIVKELASQGVTDVVATPHYVTETAYTSPATKNLKLLKELQ
jgi:protein-tyrosine phosphatase